MNIDKSFFKGLFPSSPLYFRYETVKERNNVIAKVCHIEFYQTNKYQIISSNKPICKLIDHGVR